MNEVLDLLADGKHVIIVMFKKELNAFIVTVTDNKGFGINLNVIKNNIYSKEVKRDEAESVKYDALTAAIRQGIYVLKLREDLK